MQVVTEKILLEMFAKSADVQLKKHQIKGRKQVYTVMLTYCEGLADASQINQFILPRLEQVVQETEEGLQQSEVLELSRITQLEDIIKLVYSGELVVSLLQANVHYSIDISNPPHRNPEESNTEISVKGSRDGFVEELQTNIALVRKRLRTKSLCYEQFTIGQRTKSKAGLLYIDDIIKPEIVEEARTRLQSIKIDALFSAGQLEEILGDDSYSLFPLVDYTERPDFVVDCLVHGRFVVLVDGGPIAVIAPTNLTLLFKTPEDIYMPYYYVSLQRLFRLAGLMIALLLPGFWVALGSYNLEQLPFPLLATIMVSRFGLPFPGPLEAFLMLGLFELFREAGARLPKSVGQTVAVVGGIVVGDAAIRAGLGSTTMLVVIAVTAISSYTLVNQTLSGSVSIIRLFVLILSSILGMYGFILAAIAIVLYLSKLESFGVPYLAPLSPIKFKDIISALLRKPWIQKDKRPHILQTIDDTRQGRKKK